MRTHHFRWISLTGAALCLGASLAAPAQEAVMNCQAHADERWESLGDGTLAACLLAVDAHVARVNEQGFKFGLWGGTLISADEYYFYQSGDQGNTWAPAGLKTEIAAVGGSLGQPVAATAEVLAAVEAGAEAPVAPTEVVAAAAVPPVVEAVRPRGPSAPVLEDGVRRTCSLKVNGQWQKLPDITIEDCARKLDESPEPAGSNAAKFGYWSGIYLVANRDEILKSQDSNRWETVIQRKR